MPSSTSPESSVPESERHSTASGAQMLAQDADPAVPSTKGPRLHLPYLDGIRAVMALYVVHLHMLGQVGYYHLNFRWQSSELIQIFYQGHLAVVVFIVLSGYCLTLPVLRDAGQLRGGEKTFCLAKTFCLRRARRILPPYYVALLLGALAGAIRFLWLGDTTAYPHSFQDWVLHLLLLHNISYDYIFKFNAPLWSIATEWQIYFLFPFLLLPVWKRFGEGALLTVAAVLSTVLVVLFPQLCIGCPWFIFLFAVGMCAAKVSLAPSPRFERWPWAKLGAAIVVSLYVLMRLVPAFEWMTMIDVNGGYGAGWFIVSDLIFGLATFCFLLHGTRATLEGRTSKLLSLLTWRPLVFIGGFSYSLYLIHYPIQSLFLPLLRTLHLPLSAPRLYVVLALFYLPTVLALAYAFFLLVEKPFLSAPKPRPQAEIPTP